MRPPASRWVHARQSGRPGVLQIGCHKKAPYLQLAGLGAARQRRDRQASARRRHRCALVLGQTFQRHSRERVETPNARRLVTAARSGAGDYAFARPMLIDLFRAPGPQNSFQSSLAGFGAAEPTATLTGARRGALEGGGAGVFPFAAGLAGGLGNAWGATRFSSRRSESSAD